MRYEEEAKKILNIVDKYGKNYEEKEILTEIAELIAEVVDSECENCEYNKEKEPDFDYSELD